MVYTPYGHRHTSAPGLDLIGFNGEPLDPITGHYLLGNGYRAYNPVLKRFNSPDSLSPFGKGGLNAYSYCVGDPVNRSDPSGHVFMSRVKWPGRAVRTPINKMPDKKLLPANPTNRRPRPVLEEMPSRIKEAIVRDMPGRATAQVAQLSTEFESVAMTVSAQQFDRLKIADLPFQPWLRKLDEIYFGEVEGIAPLFLARNGIPFAYVRAYLIREPRSIGFSWKRWFSWDTPFAQLDYPYHP
ncbi:RHS repeat-associated core domain-containing protein [Pseudomonas californiensis]|uniref:RHS repeat-associated core domain-containing protein n=1 Tax=Pseudomonas californiensis TaxID=2829823 RepID=UPI001E587F9F|nr:RHS repeat-associated core domain-containing protein [Pseudomonas californiensis]